MVGKIVYLRGHYHFGPHKIAMLSTERRAQIIGILTEGSSLRATSRLAQVSINTVSKLLVDIGDACAEYQDGAMQRLSCKRLQPDENWSFIGANTKHVKPGHPMDYGDVWTWVAIDADTKLVPSWHVGGRNTTDALEFMRDLASRLDARIQLSTDGHQAYIVAAERAFGGDVDYAQIIKTYGPDLAEDQKRYSPATCIGVERHPVMGDPDPAHVSTKLRRAAEPDHAH